MLSVACTRTRTGALVILSFTWGLALIPATAARADDVAPKAPDGTTSDDVVPEVDLEANALKPGETVETPLTVTEMPDGTLLDSAGRTWQPEKSTTMHAKIKNPNAEIEGSPDVKATAKVPTAPPAPILPPTDGGTSDKDFASWRSKLLDAIRTKDWTKVEPFLSKDVHWSYGEGPGVDGFKGRWKPETATSAVWPELLKVFENGGTFGKTDRGDTYFEAPYWAAWWPAAFDPVEWSLLRGTKVALLEDPKEGAKSVATLDWAIVKREQLTDPVAPRGWTQVETVDGKRGFVKDDVLENPFGYRAICGKRQGTWLVTAFLAGD